MSSRRNSPHQKNQNPGLAKSLPPFSLLRGKSPMEGPGTWAIHNESFMQDHHTVVHVKDKKEKCFRFWKRGCSHRWCLNTRKFGCCVNRWKLEGKKKKKRNHNFSIHRPDRCQAGEGGGGGVCHLTGRVLVFQSVGWGKKLWRLTVRLRVRAS